jgi:hypothetical protein
MGGFRARRLQEPRAAVDNGKFSESLSKFGKLLIPLQNLTFPSAGIDPGAPPPVRSPIFFVAVSHQRGESRIVS